MKKIRPLEALQNTISYSTLSSHLNKNPGDVVKRMSHETREALSKLTSEDAAHVNLDYIFDDTETYYQKQFSKELMDFDKRMRQPMHNILSIKKMLFDNLTQDKKNYLTQNGWTLNFDGNYVKTIPANAWYGTQLVKWLDSNRITYANNVVGGKSTGCGGGIPNCKCGCAK